MKVSPARYPETMSYILKKKVLSFREFAIFAIWFGDSESFSAGAEILKKRTGIARQNCVSTLTKMEKIGIIFLKKKTGTRRFFDFHPDYKENIDSYLSKFPRLKKKRRTKLQGTEEVTSESELQSGSIDEKVDAPATNEWIPPEIDFSDNTAQLNYFIKKYGQPETEPT